MARRNLRSLLNFLESYYFGSLLYIASISAVLIWSVILIASPVPALKKTSLATPQLAVKDYQSVQNTGPQILPEAPATEPQILGAETGAAGGQPALEAWEGPIDPIPDNPGQPTLPVFTTVPTTEPVVFLTIDDGWVQTPDESIWLRQHHLPITMFLTDNGIKNNYKFFQLLQASGMNVEDHTISHPDMTKLTLDQQRAEICGSADTFANVFGARPTMFRPPYGKANQLTLQAAADCGMKQLIMWRAVVDKGAMHYQDNLTHLNPGDIVLMHFTTNFPADIQAFVAQANDDHLQIANLEDWLP